MFRTKAHLAQVLANLTVAHLMSQGADHMPVSCCSSLAFGVQIYATSNT